MSSREHWITPPPAIINLLQAVRGMQTAYPSYKFSLDGHSANVVAKIIAEQLGAEPSFGIDGASIGQNGWMKNGTGGVRICSTAGRDYVVVSGTTDHLIVLNVDVQHLMIEVVYNGVFETALEVATPVKNNKGPELRKFYLRQLRALRDRATQS